MTFDETIRRAQDGDRDAVASLYEATSPLVLGFFRGHGMRDAEDLTGDVFVSMIRGLGRFEGDEAAFRRWLLTIAYRRYVDVLRARGRRTVAPSPREWMEEHLIDDHDPGGDAVGRIQTTEIMRAVDTLTDDQRSVFLLRIVADLPTRDVAEIVGKPETAVKALLRRSVAAMSRRLGEDGFLAPGSAA